MYLHEKYEHVYGHNEVTNDRLQKKLKSSHVCLLVQGTGTGKSYQVYQVINDMCKEGWAGTKNIKILVICPTTALMGQWKGDFDNPPEGEGGSFVRRAQSIRESSDGHVSWELPTGKYSFSYSLMTYDEMANYTKAKGEERDFSNLLAVTNKYNLIIFDEAHHMLAPIWLKCAEVIIDNAHGHNYVLGITATPRTSGDMSTSKLFKDNVIKGVSVAQAQKGDYEVYADKTRTKTKISGKQILPDSVRIASVVFDENLASTKNFRKKYVDWINAFEKKTGDTQMANQCRVLLDNMMKSFDVSSYAKIARKHLINPEPGWGQKLICIYPSNQPEEQAKEIVKKIFGISKIVGVHSDLYSSKENDENLKDFKSSREDAIIMAVDKLGEGLHIDHVTGLILLRATFSATAFQQWVGRLMSTDNVGKKMPIFDISGNFALLDDMKDNIPDELREFFDSPHNSKETDPNTEAAGIYLERIEQILSVVPEPKTRMKGTASKDLASIIPSLHQYGDLYASESLADVKKLFSKVFNKRKEVDPNYFTDYKPVDYLRALSKVDPGDTTSHMYKLLSKYTQKYGKFESYKDMATFVRTAFGAAIPKTVESDFKKNYVWRNIVDNYQEEVKRMKENISLKTDAYLAGIPLDKITALFN